ncbi:MAG: hypothetical protein WCB49_00795 [Gammaproteobacteria bacterium]
MKLLSLALLLIAAPALADPGVWTADSSATAIAPITATQIAAFVPEARGPFTFPAPYNTTGIRVTQSSDCGNGNCVNYIGYNYWANMSNSAGSNIMYIMVGLSANKGGGGPNLYSLDKTTDAVTNLGPIFTDSNKYQTGETMYFSHTMPTAMYYVSGLKTLDRIDVLTKQVTPIFSIGQYNNGQYPYMYSCTTSANDDVSSCIAENSSYARKACIVYTNSTGEFVTFPEQTSYGVHQCAITPDGKSVLMEEKTPSTCSRCDQDTVIGDVATGTQTIVGNQIGGGGHSAPGYGYYIQNMNWDLTYDGAYLWNVDDLSEPAGYVFAQPWRNQCVGDPAICSSVPEHPTWLNAVPASVTPIAQQYACDDSISSLNVPFANQVFCYNLDTSVPPAQLKSLIVAPVMTGDSNTGCGTLKYDNLPKGNIDPTGNYLIWSSNLETNTDCQVFIVKIPVSQLEPPPTPPPASVTVPSSFQAVSSVRKVVDTNGRQHIIMNSRLDPPPTPAPASVTVPSSFRAVCSVRKVVDTNGREHVITNCRRLP